MSDNFPLPQDPNWVNNMANEHNFVDRNNEIGNDPHANEPELDKKDSDWEDDKEGQELEKGEGKGGKKGKVVARGVFCTEYGFVRKGGCFGLLWWRTLSLHWFQAPFMTAWHRLQSNCVLEQMGKKRRLCDRGGISSGPRANSYLITS